VTSLRRSSPETDVNWFRTLLHIVRETSTAEQLCLDKCTLAGMDRFARQIAAALSETIRIHGPITLDLVGSATKRIAGNLREEMKRERDQILTTQPRARRRVGR
jgi:hypothetical protein